ncbi:hypothetical protein Q7C18_14060 [Nesterenkonia sp. CL21]|uniref:hypothetical protein n=1 Tax=Nesterenkonia sp. CL21 TaxID=3064894 RepID=UPI002879394C|nr:hypothetical protein [Nesterenkonia sp. CL21]MDS2173827.1 hypothetical protein [Nesterenkonia sp. CL21]
MDTVMPSLAELLTAGVLNAVADDVELVGGNRGDDLRCRIGETSFTVEVKTAWWHDSEQTIVGHSPLRMNQDPDLVALVGRFDVDEPTPTLRAIDATALTIVPDRMFFLVPTPIVRAHSIADGKSTARALISFDTVQWCQVDLTQGIIEKQLLSVLADT